MPCLCQRNLSEIQSTSKPSVGKIGWEEADDGDDYSVHGELGMQSLELHESLCGKSVVEEMIDKIVVFPVAESDV